MEKKAGQRCASERASKRVLEFGTAPSTGANSNRKTASTERSEQAGKQNGNRQKANIMVRPRMIDSEQQYSHDEQEDFDLGEHQQRVVVHAQVGSVMYIR